MYNYTDSTTSTNFVTLSIDGPANVWMYAIIATTTLFVIFLAAACYTMSEFFHRGPRPRKKDINGIAERPDDLDKGMPETPFSCCNNVPVNNITVDSIAVSRTDMPHGVRALTCNDPANTQLSIAQPLYVSAAACENTCSHCGVSVTQDSPWFCVTRPSSFCRSSDIFKNNNRAIEMHVSSKANLHCNCAAADLEETKTETPDHDTESHAKSKHSLSVLKRLNLLRKSPKSNENVRSTSLLSWKECSVCPPEALQNRQSIMTSQENVQLRLLERVCQASVENGKNLPAELSTVEMKLVEADVDTFSDIQMIGNINKETLRDTEVAASISEKSTGNSHLCSALKKLNKTNSCDNNTGTLLSQTANETETLLGESKNRVLERKVVVKDEPLVDKRLISNIRPSTILSFKSHSIEQAERKLESSEDLGCQSDDSMGHTQSLRSESSMMLRHPQMSQHLSFCKGPQININPDLVNCNSKTRSLQGGFKPRRIANIGYATYSSLDTETSTVPSSSCDSLSSKSLPYEHSIYLGKNVKVRSPDSGERTLHKNVALDSLKYHNYRQIPQRILDQDSGVGSMPFNINVLNVTNESPNTCEMVGNSAALVNLNEPSLNCTLKEYSNDDKIQAIINEDKLMRDKYGNTVCVQFNDVQLLTPFHFVKTKKGTLIKQDGNAKDILNDLDLTDNAPSKLKKPNEQIDY